jgi:hypothetical protein
MEQSFVYKWNKQWYVNVSDISDIVFECFWYRDQWVSYNWSEISIFFGEELTENQESCLWDEIDDYSIEYYTIYDYVDNEDKVPPYNEINYNIHWLKKQRIFVKWELTEINYRSEYDVVSKEYYWLVVKEENEYVRDVNWYISHRNKNIYRYTSWWEQSEPKKTTKAYSTLEATQAWERRRSNIINQLKINAVWLITQTEQIDIPSAEALWYIFMDTYTLEMSQYRDWDRQTLIDAINNDTWSDWLDNEIAPSFTVRNFLADELTY